MMHQMAPGKISLLSSLVFTIMGFSSCKGVNDSQYFTGEIAYAYSYESDVMNADSIAALRPSKGIFSYDLSGYQSRFEGRDTFTYFYSGRLKKAVAESGPQKEYSCEDYAVANDSVLSSRLLDTREKILGYSCKILEMQKRGSLVRYHVSDELKLAPATYQGHRAYNWDEYGRETGGGLILAVEHRFRNFTLKGIATRVQRRNNNFKALTLDEAILVKACGDTARKM